jgi:hypothetical protein
MLGYKLKKCHAAPSEASLHFKTMQRAFSKKKIAVLRKCSEYADYCWDRRESSDHVTHQ